MLMKNELMEELYGKVVQYDLSRAFFRFFVSTRGIYFPNIIRHNIKTGDFKTILGRWNRL